MTVAHYETSVLARSRRPCCHCSRSITWVNSLSRLGSAGSEMSAGLLNTAPRISTSLRGTVASTVDWVPKERELRRGRRAVPASAEGRVRLRSAKSRSANSESKRGAESDPRAVDCGNIVGDISISMSDQSTIDIQSKKRFSMSSDRANFEYRSLRWNSKLNEAKIW